jgi:XRE family aerobic/anaerobic benzoate catabolism transcriptional regulator
LTEISTSVQLGQRDVGTRLRAARAKIGMTRKQLAVASGTSERYLAHIEAGTGNPTVAVLDTLATALGLAPAELLPMGGETSEIHAKAAAMLRRLPDARLPVLIDQMRRPAAAIDSAKAKRIVLIGLRGAGKSSLGLALAERFSVPFLEMSREVERVYGGEMGLLIELGGQSALRRYEHEAWDAILADHEAAIIATPGGIVAHPMLFDRLLDTAHTIWLQASPEDHMRRVVEQGDFRPMASNRNAMQDLEAILDARSPDYARASATLQTSGLDLDAAADALERIARSLVE